MLSWPGRVYIETKLESCFGGKTDKTWQLLGCKECRRRENMDDYPNLVTDWMWEMRKREATWLTPNFLTWTTRSGSGDVISQDRKHWKRSRCGSKRLGQRTSPVQAVEPVRQLVKMEQVGTWIKTTDTGHKCSFIKDVGSLDLWGRVTSLWEAEHRIRRQ